MKKKVLVVLVLVLLIGIVFSSQSLLSAYSQEADNAEEAYSQEAMAFLSGNSANIVSVTGAVYFPYYLLSKAVKKCNAFSSCSNK